jgi:signal transduction histidine kinase
MQNKKLNKIIKKFNIVYGITLIALFLASAAFIMLSNYQNKVHVANSISNIVEEKLKNNDKRDVVKILSSAQIGDFKAISYYNSEGKRTITFPASINPSYFKESGLIDNIKSATLDVHLYFDKNREIKSGTLRFSIDPFDSIPTVALIWLIFTIILIPIARHYKRLIIRNFEQEAKESKADAVKEIVRQIRHDSRGAIQAIKAVLDSSNNLDELELDILRSATQRLEVMMNDTKINKAKTINHKTSSQQNALCHIHTCISDIVREKNILFTTNNQVELDFKYDDESLKIFLKLNETEIKRIVSNILDNSFDAIKQKSEQGIIQISLTVVNDTLRLIIKDNGIGIKPELMGNIGKKGYTLKSNGTGLGISWAINKIKEYGGEFNIESIYNEWTEISIDVPLADTGLSATNRINLDNYNTIVAIDDDPSVIRTWKNKILTDSKYSVGFFSYESGEEYFLSHQDDDKTLYLIDYDLGPSKLKGTEIASMIGKSDNIILVSNNFDDWEIQKYCRDNKVKIIPKTIVPDITVLY